MAKWAEEMQRCQSIMSEMASCQRIFEQKAIDAEEKLRKWRKKNPLKGDGKSGYDGSGKKKSSDPRMFCMVSLEFRSRITKNIFGVSLLLSPILLQKSLTFFKRSRGNDIKKNVFQ